MSSRALKTRRNAPLTRDRDELPALSAASCLHLEPDVHRYPELLRHVPHDPLQRPPTHPVLGSDLLALLARIHAPEDLLIQARRDPRAVARDVTLRRSQTHAEIVEREPAGGGGRGMPQCGLLHAPVAPGHVTAWNRDCSERPHGSRCLRGRRYSAAASRCIAASKARLDARKSVRRTKARASWAPYSRSIPESSHSMESGPA